MRTRKLCTSPHHLGPRWLLSIEFSVKVWGDIEGTWVAQLQSECKACQRLRARRRKAIASGRDPDTARPSSPRSRSEKLVAKRASYARLKQDPLWIAHRRRILREATAAKRREAGVAVRGPWHRYRHEQPPTWLNAEPLLRWLEPLLEADEAWLSRSDAKRNGIGGSEGGRPLLASERLLLSRSRSSGLIKDSAADALLLRLGRPDIFAALYGDVASSPPME